jgi:hypothetical protein
MTFSQEAARKPVKDTTAIHSKKPEPKSEVKPEVNSEPQIVTQTQVQADTIIADKGIQFSLAGILLGSLQNWNDLKTDKSKLGFGFSGDLFAGIILDDMYIGLGPHFGYNFWTVSESAGGITASATTDVSDFGLDLGAAWEGFYMTLGFGAGNSSVTGTVQGESQTVDIPGSIDYTRVGFGWFDGFAVGIAFMNYSDSKVQNNLNRLEFNFGWSF